MSANLTLPERLASIGATMAAGIARESAAQKAWRHALRRVWERGGPFEVRHGWQQRPAFLAHLAAMGGGR